MKPLPFIVLGIYIMLFVIVGLIAVALRRIPKAGKWIMG